MDELTVSWSELDTYRQCPFKHHLAYDQRYSKAVDAGSALDKGLLWHGAIETRYKTIQAHQVMHEGRMVWDVASEVLAAECHKAVNAYLSKALRDGADVAVVSLVAWMMEGYVDTYGLDDVHDIMGVETTHLAPLGTISGPHEGERTKVWLKFKIDRTVRDQYGHIRVIDEKSCSALPTDSDYDFADQFGLYVWGLKALGLNVRGAVHSAAKTKQNQGDVIPVGHPEYKKSMKAQSLEDRYRRTSIHFTAPQLKEIADDALADVQQMYTKANHGRRHTNNDTCRWRCNFREACLYGRRTGRNSDTVRMLELTGFTQERERH